MTIKEKLKKTKRNATIARIVIAMSILYGVMIIIKSTYVLTDGNSVNIVLKVNELMRWIIQNTYFPPFDFIWNNIPSNIFNNENIFSFYKVIIPPLVVLGISSLFINDYRLTRRRYNELENTIEKEKELHNMRKEAGIYTVEQSATVDVRIKNEINADPLWHNTWWGKIVIGVLITMIIAFFGINK